MIKYYYTKQIKFYHDTIEEKLNHRIFPKVIYFYRNGKLHQENSPAIEAICKKKSKGSRTWMIDGVLHRDNGPAVETDNGLKQWWVNGKCIKFEE